MLDQHAAINNVCKKSRVNVRVLSGKSCTSTQGVSGHLTVKDTIHALSSREAELILELQCGQYQVKSKCIVRRENFQEVKSSYLISEGQNYSPSAVYAIF